MVRISPKIFQITAAVVSMVVVCSGQFDLPTPKRSDYKGRVKLVTFIREYWIIGGSAVGPKQVLLNQTEFNLDGKVIRQSEYGNVERRETYTYSDKDRTVEIKYFDSDGRPTRWKKRFSIQG